MDWLAAIAELCGAWMIGDRNRFGFLVFLIGNALWIAVALRFEVYGLLPVSLILGAVNIRNYMKWSHRDS